MTGGTDWETREFCLETGRRKRGAAQAGESVLGWHGKAAKGQGRLIRSVAQILERPAETLRIMA